MKQEQKIHHGENVKKLRELLGTHKQELLAEELGISQASMSRLESQSYIDDETLTKIATAMGISVDAIKNFDMGSAVEILSNSFHDKSVGCQYQCTISPIEKVSELYERIIREKEEAMCEKQELLERMLRDRDLLIEEYKRLINIKLYAEQH